MSGARRPQYRVLAALLRQTTAELLIKGLDENGIRVKGTERRRDRLVKRVLPVVEKLNALGIGLGNRNAGEARGPRRRPEPQAGPGAQQES